MSTSNFHNNASRAHNRLLLKELPFFDFRGNLNTYLGPLNNSLRTGLKAKNNLERLSSLYDLSVFNSNMNVDPNLDSHNNLLFQRIRSHYYSPRNFSMKNKAWLSADHSNLSVLHNNIRSLKLNFEDFQTHLLDELDHKFDIIGFTETKINSRDKNISLPELPDYHEFESVPTPLSFGGVGMFIHSSLNYKILEKTSNEAFQALWIELCFTQKKNVIVGVVYRQHNSPERFLQYFDDTIEKFISSDKPLCILGDFNLDLLKFDTCRFCRDFLLSLQSYYLIPSIDKPTRVYNNSATLIDNIFINNPERVTVSGNLISDITDHFSQFCIFNSCKDKKQIPTKQKMRDYSRFSATCFNNELSAMNWNQIILNNENNIDKLFSSFYKTLNNVVNKHAPVKTVSRRKMKQISKPWISSGIRAAIQIKHT